MHGPSKENGQLVLKRPKFLMVFREEFLKSTFRVVTKCKFVCPMHSEVKQTKTSEFGAEKGSLQGHARGTGGSCPPKPQTPPRISAKHF